MTALRLLLIGLAAGLVPAGIVVGIATIPAFAAPNRSVQEPTAGNGGATTGDKAGVKKVDDDDDDDDKPDAKPGLSKPGLSKPGLSKPGLSKSDLSKSDLSKPDQVKPDQAHPDQAKADKDDDDDDQSAIAKARFPQPVQVGQLIGRDVLQPLESQPLLGHVRRLVRKPDGAVVVIVDYGGWFGWGARPIAVPLSAMALLGADMSIFGYKPDQLATFPTVTAEAGEVLPAGETIRVGLTKPAH